MPISFPISISAMSPSRFDRPATHTPSMVALAVGALALLGPIRTTHASDPPVRFVAAGDVAEMLDDATILDTRSIGAYLAGHLPNAHHLDDERLRGARDGLPVQYLAADELAAIFGSLGVSFDRPVVVYASQDDPLPATMTAYALARVGHDEIHVLSGGFGSWAANHETSQAYPASPSSSAALEPLTPREPTIDAIRHDEFADDVGYADRVFIDARPANQYRGDAGVWARNGHIPTAHSLDWTRLVHGDAPHRLRSRAEIEGELEALGVSEWDDVVVYCGTGREATLLLLALRCELEWENVRLYEGSWTEYSTIAGAPIEIGARSEPRTRVHRDGRIRISGQPTKDELRALVEDGVRTVIACRTQREIDALDFDPASFLDALGARFVHVPMGGRDEYAPHQVDAVADAIDATSDGDVLVHCASGGRARLAWMAWLVERRGVSLDDAVRRSLAMGGSPSSLERLLDREVRYEFAETVESATPAEPAVHPSHQW